MVLIRQKFTTRHSRDYKALIDVHVAVPVKRAHATNDLVVVSQVNKHLRVILHAAHEDAQRPRAESSMLVGSFVLHRRAALRGSC